ncbi:hypothetical protein [Corynebacterium sp.]|nr:hypothetical protein [Corynebacterium sp.]
MTITLTDVTVSYPAAGTTGRPEWTMTSIVGGQRRMLTRLGN